jgi:hypothetical protein
VNVRVRKKRSMLVTKSYKIQLIMKYKKKGVAIGDYILDLKRAQSHGGSS